MRVLSGRDPHHIVEAQFKAVARALRAAVARDPRVSGVPSAKGSLSIVNMPWQPAHGRAGCSCCAASPAGGAAGLRRGLVACHVVPLPSWTAVVPRRAALARRAAL